MTARRRMLIEAVELLAADATTQEQRLAQFFGIDKFGPGACIDEIALQFDDIAAARDDMLAENEISPDEFKAIASIDGELEAMSGQKNADLWIPSALTTSPKWADIRQRARECLSLLNGTEGGSPGAKQRQV